MVWLLSNFQMDMVIYDYLANSAKSLWAFNALCGPVMCMCSKLLGIPVLLWLDSAPGFLLFVCEIEKMKPYFFKFISFK